MYCILQFGRFTAEGDINLLIIKKQDVQINEVAIFKVRENYIFFSFISCVVHVMQVSRNGLKMYRARATVSGNHSNWECAGLTSPVCC